MPSGLKKLLIAIVVIVCCKYGLDTISSIQTAEAFAKCIKEIAPQGKPLFTNEEEARLYTHTLLNCVEKRNGFFARLYFDKDKSERSVTFTNN